MGRLAQAEQQLLCAVGGSPRKRDPPFGLKHVANVLLGITPAVANLLGKLRDVGAKPKLAGRLPKLVCWMHPNWKEGAVTPPRESVSWYRLPLRRQEQKVASVWNHVQEGPVHSQSGKGRDAIRAGTIRRLSSDKSRYAYILKT